MLGKDTAEWAGGHAFLAFNAAGQVWNGVDSFVPWVQTDSTSYKITATQLGTSGLFFGTEPAGAVKWYLCGLTSSQFADPITEALTILDQGDIFATALNLPVAAPGTVGGLPILDASLGINATQVLGDVLGNVDGSVHSVQANVGGSIQGNVNGNVNGKVIGGGSSSITGVGAQVQDATVVTRNVTVTNRTVTITD